MDDTDSRTAIKLVALELLVRHGYRGMSFADIAGELAITRANIHYHFGSKARLVEEVLAGYVASTLGQLATIWERDRATLRDKIEATLDYSRERFRSFNAGDGEARPWSLISRLRQDEELLSGTGRAQLRDFTAELRRIFGRAVEGASRGAELRPSARTSWEAVTTLLVAIADNAAPITMSGSGFADLEAAYRALIQLIEPDGSPGN